MAKTYTSRGQLYKELFPEAPRYRLEQIERALLAQIDATSFMDISTLSLNERKNLEERVPFFALREKLLLVSKNHDTCKVLLESDLGIFESVLMKNMRGDWTICVSSQIGCGMGCKFCATGTMGFKANLHYDLILDQLRYWQHFVAKNENFGGRISNIVFMGMGEPLANYDNVKQAINLILKYTDIGPTKITVSSVGVLPVLRKILSDNEFPPVRIAISLHSADKETRKEIVPTSSENFLKELQSWVIDYLDLFGNRSHHITFEYVMLKEVNDTSDAAIKLGRFIAPFKQEVKVNLIPYNTTGSEYERSEDVRIMRFADKLRSNGVSVTVRKNMGNDINAACGQLVTLANAAKN